MSILYSIRIQLYQTITKIQFKEQFRNLFPCRFLLYFSSHYYADKFNGNYFVINTLITIIFVFILGIMYFKCFIESSQFACLA